MPSSCSSALRRHENFRFSHNAKLDTPGFLWQGTALKFSRGVLRNSVEFPPVAKFDASPRRGDTIIVAKRILPATATLKFFSVYFFVRVAFTWRIFPRLATLPRHSRSFPFRNFSSGLLPLRPLLRDEFRISRRFGVGALCSA